MPFRASHQIDLPVTSIASFVFESPKSGQQHDGPSSRPAPTDPLYLDAADPERNYLSLETYRLWSQRVALGLTNRGFKLGDVALIYSTNSIYYMPLQMGIMMAGGIFTGSSPAYVARELAYHWKDSAPKFVFVYPEGLENGLKAAKEAGITDDQIFIFDGQGAPPSDKKYSHPHWTEILAPDAEAKNYQWDRCETEEKMDRTVALNYSSGTTGMPKGVEITHRNYIANLSQMKFESGRRPDPFHKGSVHLCFLPLNHAMAQVGMNLGVSVFGGRCYVRPKFDFVQMLQDVQRYKVNFLSLVPPVIVAMSKSPLLRQGKVDLSAVAGVGSGAAPISGETLEAFREIFPNRGKDLHVRNGYGQSEATCAICWGPTDADPAKIHSVGVLMANMEAKLVADDGSEVTQWGPPGKGTPGELWVKGPNVMKGYWRKPEATADTITPDGWLKTGDVVTVDDEGLIYIVDRKKELIKVKGNQVAPADLEALLLEHSAIRDAAVIGVPSPDGTDEVPRAYVQLQEGADPKQIDEANIQRFVEERAARYKRLLGGVRFMPNGIPKNPSGKILRKILREEAKKEREGPKARL